MLEILAQEFCTPIEIYRRMEAWISGEHANETSAGKYLKGELSHRDNASQHCG